MSQAVARPAAPGGVHKDENLTRVRRFAQANAATTPMETLRFRARPARYGQEREGSRGESQGKVPVVNP